MRRRCEEPQLFSENISNERYKMLRASCLASILAAARGFGSPPHAVENACRNKETPVAVSHAEMIADCVAAGIPEMECTAELAEMQAAGR